MPEPLPARFPCPECRAPLRLRDRRYVGAVFACPECGANLKLRELADGVADVCRAEQGAEAQPAQGGDAAKVRGTRSAITPSETPESPLIPPERAAVALPAWLTSPVTISWGVACLFGCVFLWLAWRPSGAPVDVAQPLQNPPGSDRPQQELVEQNPQPTAAPWRAQPQDSPEQRLQRLGAGLAEFESRFGEWPRGTQVAGRPLPAEGWSWQAQLEARLSEHPQARNFVADRLWSDPASERFVRRQVPEFINPSVRQPVGEQGYPTTHFVGSGGLGADGPTLAVTQPRAGLFGWNRTTRAADVTDGLAQTIAVLGVESQLGSWAEGGRATIRPLTAEPIIRGPDGFGTGTPDQMLVLMADGSVRTITPQTDPRLVRRMIAISDGLPLDLKVPGEPGDAPPPSPAPSAVHVPPVVMNPPDEPPVSATVATNPPIPAVKRPPIGPLLAQPLLGISQTAPRPRRELLTIVEDLLGRPIAWEAAELGTAAAALQEPIVLPLTGGTVGELFTHILAGTGLTYVVEPEAVRLIRVSDADSRPGGSSGTR